MHIQSLLCKIELNLSFSDINKIRPLAKFGCAVRKWMGLREEGSCRCWGWWVGIIKVGFEDASNTHMKLNINYHSRPSCLPGTDSLALKKVRDSLSTGLAQASETGNINFMPMT